jgi:hypothetical protein
LVNSIVPNLVPAIVAYVAEAGGYVTKTKLLKLLYLLDVEFFRLHRQTLTGFNWKFFHLGPWTAEFDPLIEGLITSGILLEQPATKPDYDTKFYHVEEQRDVGKLFTSANDEFLVKGILKTWSQSPTGEILDFVYFHTEPMEHGIRSQPLDFNSISEAPAERYVRATSGLSSKRISELRRNFRKQREKLERPAFHFTQPRYDEEFEKGMSKLRSS